MAVFTQYWYWFPLTISLLYHYPTAVIGVDQDLEIPSFKFHSATRPSMFDYPPEQEVKMEEALRKSRLRCSRRRTRLDEEAAEERQQRRESMDVDPGQTPTTPKPDEEMKMSRTRRRRERCCG